DAHISFYKQGEFTDLCAGPHLDSTGRIKGNAIKLTACNAAYWRGDSKRETLQRIYGVAFPKKEELDEYLAKLEEAKKRDHRKLGRELGLFMTDELVGRGLPMFLPKGYTVWRILENYIRDKELKLGYQHVLTPCVGTVDLYKTSGHWDHYKNNMYSTVIDDEIYCIKPMNCPGGVMVYRAQPHSYKELPMRVGELGLVHRHELKGALHGLFRVRCFTQDDAHIFMRRDQIEEEIMGVVHLINEVYQKFGFKYFIELSTRPEDSMGSDEDWEAATQGLKGALDKLGLPYTINEGDGAFYGPKIDFHLEDSIGRTWQCGTIQLDFQMPLNFGLEYVDENGEKQRPIMIHRVCFGSIERFIGILTEHFAGKFPVWLAPTQVKVLLVSEKSEAWGQEVYEALKAAKVRVEFDNRNEKIGYKIRQAQLVDRVPYMVIIGEKEAEDKTVSLRYRDTTATEVMTLDDFIAKVVTETRERA
ncbi:MAG TPA: threonine--tRNA ligase, partial [Clostridiales bacterium]|nr:threonine--tRNA ligase [Clostridiales bacterium]